MGQARVIEEALSKSELQRIGGGWHRNGRYRPLLVGARRARDWWIERLSGRSAGQEQQRQAAQRLQVTRQRIGLLGGFGSYGQFFRAPKSRRNRRYDDDHGSATLRPGG